MFKVQLSIGAFGKYLDDFQQFEWDTTTGKQVRKIATGNAMVDIAWSHDGNIVGTLVENEENYSHLEIRSYPDLSTIVTYPEKDSGLVIKENISWDSKGQKLFGAACEVVSGACYLWIWDRQSNQFAQPFQLGLSQFDGNTGGFTVLALSPSGELLAVNDISTGHDMWEVKTGKWVGTLNSETKGITSLDWDPSSTKLVTGNTKGEINILERSSK